MTVLMKFLQTPLMSFNDLTINAQNLGLHGEHFHHVKTSKSIALIP